MKNNYFFWPKPKFSNVYKSYFYKTHNIEDILNKYFPSGYPVLFPSARSALYFCIIYNRLNRENFVEYFPYANECILSSISQVTNPVPLNFYKNSDLKISYHHWGYQIKLKNHNKILEDSADSLYLKNSKLFNSNGNFEIWSLPKILGTFSGGILWCKDINDYNEIKKIYPDSKIGFVNSFSKLFSHKSSYFYNLWKAECYSNFNLPNFYRKEIYRALENWSYYTDLVQKNIEIISTIIEDWVPKNNNRLPCVIPFKEDLKIFNILKNKGIKNDLRMFNVNFDENDQKYEKVYSVPVHYQVNKEFLKKIISIIK
jgi:putative PLP-dependent aminotransferase (TIGR04422 family)